MQFKQKKTTILQRDAYAQQWRSESGAGVQAAPGGTCQGRQTG